MKCETTECLSHKVQGFVNHLLRRVTLVTLIDAQLRHT